MEIFSYILRNPGQVSLTTFTLLLSLYLLWRERELHAELVALLKQYEVSIKESVVTLTILAEKLEK